MCDNQQLIDEYTTNGSEEAFRELVARYIDFVYSTALRLVYGDASSAEDVTQTVFISLARKAAGIKEEVKLGGWLHPKPLWPTLPDEDWISFNDRSKVFGEESALRWVTSKYSQK